MKKIACLLIMSVMMGNNARLFAQQTATAGEKTYKNPLPVVFGDPYVLHVKGDKYTCMERVV